jgi:CRP-like cAMP-binding protein
VLYKVAVLNYLMIFFNLLPQLELDGYHILSEAIDVPDLRPRSLAFVRHDFLHKIRNRERLSKTDWGLLAFGLVGIGFVVFSYYTSVFFWRNIFGGLVRSMWHGGTVGRVILLILGVVLFGPAIRGLVSLTRLVWRKVVTFYRNVKFRLETSWRVEAGELIDALPLFDELDEDALNDIAGRVRLRAFRRGQAVVRQGERATAFYVVRSGTFHVIEENPDTGEERIMRALSRGEAFGELAVAQAATRRATVRAVEDSEVFEITKSDFDRLLATRLNLPDLAPTLQDVAELRELSAFSHLEQDELAELLRYGTWVTVAAGETVVAKGEVAETFYAIRSGQFEVLDGRKVVALLGAGQYFGEVGLLLHVRRTATVRAHTAGRLYRLNRTGFNRLVRDAFKRGTLDTSGLAGRPGRRR